MLDARQREAENDSEGKGTEGSLCPGETYSVQREWDSEEYQAANADLEGKR